MQTDTEKRPAASPTERPQRPPKTRSRITAACVRCQKRKIRCDALIPACSACSRAGAKCVGGGSSREIPRSYVNDLESRIEWLESIVREHVPSIDLSTGPGRPSGTLGVVPKDGNAPQIPQGSPDLQGDESLDKISDQIGLVSITTGSDLRYLGPSSGLFFTKFVLAGLGKLIHVEKPSALDSTNDNVLVPPDLLVPQPRELPSEQRHTRWLSQAYFDNVHLQFPFLHEPSHWEIINQLYNGGEVGAVHKFQVLMVLAIGATILSRRTKVMLSAEGYYASAMNLVDSIVKTASVEGVQSILLLEMYTLNNPSSGLSLWPLHHHCLALTIELGLHRNVPRGVYTPFQRELRTRIFWCTYTIDRLLSTLMGRPMGVVDEQCELRFPLDISDDEVKSDEPKPRQEGDSFTNLTSAIHLFKLARFNSEIKCVLYCVDRQYPPYTQPVIVDAETWKVDILNRLRKWRRDIPRHPEGSPQRHLSILSEIKYHELVMLVLRPSPRLQYPDKASLHECFTSAINCSKLYHQLYATNSLHYGWISVHSLFVCVMVMFYCVWTPQGIADQVDVDCLMHALKASSDVLSAMGEYWPEAKRSRDILDRVSKATTRRFTQNLRTTQSNPTPVGSLPSVDISSMLSSEQTADWTDVDLSSNNMPSLQFENEGLLDTVFPPNYGGQDDAFTSADILSYFLGSGTDIMMSGSSDFASVAGMGNAFGESLQDYEHIG